MRKLSILETPEDIVEAFSPVRDGNNPSPFPFVGQNARLKLNSSNYVSLVGGNESIKIEGVSYDELCDYVLAKYGIIVEDRHE